MAKATLFILIAVAAGLLVYLLAAPKFQRVGNSPHTEPLRTSQPAPPEIAAAGSSIPENPPKSTRSGSATDSVDSAPSIDAPLTGEQRSQKDLEARRGSLYAWIRTNFQAVLSGWQPSSADPATLNLYMVRTDSSAASDITLCMNRLVEPYATKYGFNHVSFFVPNPTDDTNHWRLDSEATLDESGAWRLYKK